MSCSAKETPYRIIWRCVPSPQSTSNVSPSRTIATDATLRSTVGRDAEVPRRRTASDMAVNILRRGPPLARNNALDAAYDPLRRNHEEGVGSLAAANTWVRSLHTSFRDALKGEERRGRGTRMSGERGTGQSGPPLSGGAGM